MRIISINGVDPGDYFRDWGRNSLRLDENDGVNLNEILAHGAYSLRFSGGIDLPPLNAIDTYVLETANGRKVTIEMPWVFFHSRLFSGIFPPFIPIPASTAQFNALCTEPNPLLGLNTVNTTESTNDGNKAESLWRINRAQETGSKEFFLQELMEKRETVKEFSKAKSRAEYFELAPGRKNQHLEDVTEGETVKALGDRATIIRLTNFISNWKSQVIAGTNYACENTDRLMLDLRGNAGGHISKMEWLVTHLFPDRTAAVDYSFLSRKLGDHPGLNELSERGTQASQDYFNSECVYGLEAACWADPETGIPFSDKEWMSTNTVIEDRGGVLEVLGPLIQKQNHDLYFQPGVETIACPGKFQDETLIVFSDGTGASMSHFFSEIIRDQAVLVTSGGYVGEPLVSGIARGGLLHFMQWQSFDEQQLAYSFPGYGPPIDPLPILRRNVGLSIEQSAGYLKDQSSLLIEQMPVGDLHINVWADSPSSDGYVYDRVINAVQRSHR